MATWTPEEDEAIRRMYPTKTRVEMAAALGRTEGMVRSRCWTLGLNSKLPQWTANEEELLRRHYAATTSTTLKLPALARALGRNKTNVCRKARAMGLTDPSRSSGGQIAIDFRTRAGSTEHLELVRKVAKGRWTRHPHPRGALGMKLTEENKAKMAAGIRRAFADPNHIVNSPEYRQRLSDRTVAMMASRPTETNYSRCARGRRADLGAMFFRSRWEANYARYLNLMVTQGSVASWEFEPHTFWFEHIKRGVRSYLPDFKVILPDGSHEWHEVKGWMDAKSKTKLARMGRCYPEERVKVIGAPWFRNASKTWAHIIPCWEKDGPR